MSSEQKSTVSVGSYATHVISPISGEIKINYMGIQFTRWVNVGDMLDVSMLVKERDEKLELFKELGS